MPGLFGRAVARTVCALRNSSIRFVASLRPAQRRCRNGGRCSRSCDPRSTSQPCARCPLVPCCARRIFGGSERAAPWARPSRRRTPTRNRTSRAGHHSGHNQVELWFAKIQRDVIRRGVLTSVADLGRKLRRYIAPTPNQPSYFAGPIQIPAGGLALTESPGQLTSFCCDSIRSVEIRFVPEEPARRRTFAILCSRGIVVWQRDPLPRSWESGWSSHQRRTRPEF